MRATNYHGVWGAGLQTADGRCGGTLEAPAPSVKRSAGSGKTLRLHPTGGRAPSRSAQTYRPRSRAAPRATARAGIMPFPTGRRCTGRRCERPRAEQASADRRRVTAGGVAGDAACDRAKLLPASSCCLIGRGGAGCGRTTVPQLPPDVHGAGMRGRRIQMLDYRALTADLHGPLACSLMACRVIVRQTCSARLRAI